MRNQVYNCSPKKSKVKKIGGKPSGILSDKSKQKGDDSMDKAETKSFKKKSEYYISLSEIIYKIKKHAPSDLRKPFMFSSEFVRFRKTKSPVVEYHENIKARYVACVVDKNLEFGKLKKRDFRVGKHPTIKNKDVYYIPLYFIRSLLPDEYERLDNIAVELADINVFKYTGNIESFQSLNIFSLSNGIYLTNKPELNDLKIHVII